MAAFGSIDFVSLDFETTGVVKGWASEPWQLGVVACGASGRFELWETWFRVARERPFSPRAPGRWAELRETLAAAPAFEELWPELAARLVGVPLVAHNAATERTLLTKRAPLTSFGPWVDTLKLARRLWPRLASYALGDLIAAFGLREQVEALCPGRTWHDALYDACAGAVLCRHIMRALDAPDVATLRRYL